MKTKTKSITKKKVAPRKKKKMSFKSGLSGFLVVWRHTMDDVPLGLFADEKEAIKVATTITWRQSYDIARKLDIDCSTPVCFAYATFKNGIASAFTVVDRKDDF
jgi:hypothetical protein